MSQQNQKAKKVLSKAERQAELLDRKRGDIKKPHNKHGDKSESAKR